MEKECYSLTSQLKSREAYSTTTIPTSHSTTYQFSTIVLGVVEELQASPNSLVSLRNTLLWRLSGSLSRMVWSLKTLHLAHMVAFFTAAAEKLSLTFSLELLWKMCFQVDALYSIWILACSWRLTEAGSITSMLFKAIQAFIWMRPPMEMFQWLSILRIVFSIPYQTVT